MTRRLLLTLLISSPLGLAAPLTAADYRKQTHGKWALHVQISLDDHPRRQQALNLLHHRLDEIDSLLPEPVLKELRKVPIWLSRNAGPGACYHPSRRWLRENSRIVEMAQTIEIQNIDHFIDWSATQPMMVLHELAHAWHHRVLEGGYENAEIVAAFDSATDAGIYQKVRHLDGREVRHYALTNAMEYFAEATEAYFGRNDFHPFNRDELLAFDPAGHALVRKMWQRPPAPPDT